MNKVISINIGGSIFQVEENAYTRLNEYLNSLKQYFMNKPEGNEVITDIENRIAELLQEKLNALKSAITSDDVNEVISSMGSPKDFAMEEEETQHEQNSTGAQSNTQQNQHARARIYRDPEGRIMGGVCSGLGYYFNIDPLWIRLIFVVLMFAGGSAILIYIVLWIIIPEAKTTAEKLQMRKEKINVDNIQKSVQTEFSKVKDKVQSRNFQDQAVSFARKFADLIKIVVLGILRIAGRFAGVIFFIAAVMFFLSSAAVVTGKIYFNKMNMINPFINNFFENPNDKLMATLAVTLGLISAGFLSLLIARAFMNAGRPVKRNYPLRITTLVLVILAGVLCFISTGKTVSYFANNQTVQRNIPLDTTCHHYYLRSLNENEGWRYLHVYDDTLRLGDIDLVIEKTDGEPELIEYRSAYGQNADAARLNASGVIALVNAHDSVITLPHTFTFAESQPFRAQQVKYRLRLPAGYTFTFDRNFNNDVHFGQSYANEFDEPENNNTYIMTANGVRCSDCDPSAYEHVNLGAYPFDYTNHGASITKIVASTAMKIRIVKGNEFAVKAKGLDSRRDLDIDYDDHTLRIRQRSHWGIVINEVHPEVVIIVPQPEEIRLTGSVDAEISGFHQDNMNIDLSGAVKCRMDVSVNKLTIEASGASKILLSGTTHEASIEMKGASRLSALNMEIERLDIDLAGACDAEVYVTSDLDATAVGASNVRYKGNPSKVNDQSAGAGSVRAIE
jgi:phage shock protein PspC (stress-responsive transcriptional regulator)